MFYVMMTDKFMSGWGLAKNKKNKLIYEEAVIAKENADKRPDMIHVNICLTKPHYNSNNYYSQIKTKTECPNWCIRGYF